MLPYLAYIPAWALYALIPLVLLLLMFAGNGFVFIGNDSYGVVERRWSFRGSGQSGFMALDGGAGFLPRTIKGGWHSFVPY